MEEKFDLETEISAGKKSFTVVPENGGYTLVESGSIVAVIKKKEGIWAFTQGSYKDEDAHHIGKLIESRRDLNF